MNIDERILRPEPCCQLLTSNQLAWPFEQSTQNQERLWLHPQPAAVFPQLTGTSGDFEGPETVSNHGQPPAPPCNYRRQETRI